MRYLLTADELGADEALRIGLVQEVVPAGTQLGRALSIARVIAEQAPLGVRATLANAVPVAAAAERAAVEHLRETLPRGSAQSRTPPRACAASSNAVPVGSAGRSAIRAWRLDCQAVRR